MQHLINSLLEEIDGAEEYYKAAKSEMLNAETRRTYKEIGLQELTHFEKLCNIYKIKIDEAMKNAPVNGLVRDEATDASDMWIRYFKNKAEELREELNKL